MSVPSLLLVIVINVSMKPRLVNWMDEQFLLTGNAFYRNTILVDFVLVFGSLALIKWPKAARIIRGQIMSVRNKNYVLAAEAIGVPTAKIVWKYVIPNSIGPIIVYISAALGEAMVFESSFSFLGVGVRPPIPSWGTHDLGRIARLAALSAHSCSACRSACGWSPSPSVSLVTASTMRSTRGNGNRETTNS